MSSSVYTKSGSENIPTWKMTNLTFGLTHYWPINNDMKDYIGSSDIIPQLNINFASDRFGNANSSIFLNYGWGTVKPDYYFKGSSFVIMAWIMPLSLPTNNYFCLLDFSSTDNSDVSVLYAVGGDGPWFSIFFETQYLISSTIQLKLNQWNHLAAVFNGTTMMLYVNGILGRTQTSSSILFNTNYTSCAIGGCSYKEFIK